MRFVVGLNVSALEIQPRGIDRLFGNEWVVKGVVLDSFLIDELIDQRVSLPLIIV